jgi:hypothetical protein
VVPHKYLSGGFATRPGDPAPSSLLIPQTLPAGQHHPGIALPAAGTIKGTSSLQGGYSSPWKSSKNFCRKDLETFEAKSHI